MAEEMGGIYKLLQRSERKFPLVNSEIRQKAATVLRWLSEDVNSIRSSKQ